MRAKRSLRSVPFSPSIDGTQESIWLRAKFRLSTLRIRILSVVGLGGAPPSVVPPPSSALILEYFPTSGYRLSPIGEFSRACGLSTSRRSSGGALLSIRFHWYRLAYGSVPSGRPKLAPPWEDGAGHSSSMLKVGGLC